MLLFSLLPLLSLALVSARKSSTGDSDTKSTLIALAAANNGVVKLNDDTYDLLTSPDRDWSSVIQLTALGKNFKCPPCKELDPAFRAMGRAWSGVKREDRDQHFFATLDFEDGQQTFRKLGLASAPVIRVMPPAQGPRAPANGKSDGLVVDFAESGFDAAVLADRLSRHTPVPIPYKAPPNYALIATTMGSIVAFAIVARTILPLLASRWTWAVMSIGTCLIMVGGFMFVRIRGMPYVAGNPDGKAQLIMPGFQNQYGIEVQIVAFIYGLLSLNFIVLTLLVPQQKSAARQRYGVYIWTSISFALFSVLLSIFRIKNGGYPFRLLL